MTQLCNSSQLIYPWFQTGQRGRQDVAGAHKVKVGESKYSDNMGVSSYVRMHEQTI